MSLPILSLSQAHLTLLDTCPRKFQYVFDRALALPGQPQQQEAATWGNQFHLLMQQRALGLPIAALAQTHPDMASQITSLEAQAPELFSPVPEERLRQSEHQRTLLFNGYLLTTVYDLLLLDDNGGHIVDWKSYLRPPSRARLADAWQTQLYLYVLAETANLPPEQITMDYWFVRQHQEGQLLPPSATRFRYSQPWHDHSRTRLLQLTENLTALRLQSAEFPKTSHQELCSRCPFQLRCQRLPVEIAVTDVSAVKEVPLH